MDEQVTVSQLGQLIKCELCGVETYSDKNLPESYALPPGFTVGNRRMFVSVGNIRHLVCQNCRHDRLEAY